MNITHLGLVEAASAVCSYVKDKETVMAAAGIMRPEFECYGHHRHFPPPPSHAVGPVLVEFAGAENPCNLDRNTNDPSSVNTHLEEEK